MPAAMPPGLIIDHIWALDSAALAAVRSAAACFEAVVSNGIEATVIASPRAVSRPTELPMRDWIWFWFRLPATALSITNERVGRLSAPGAASIVVVVLSTALLSVVDVLS